MGAPLKSAYVGLTLLALAFPTVAGEGSATRNYTQKALLKNWTLSVCLATVAKGAGDRADADATASAYMEAGRQGIEAYDALRKLVDQYTARKYAGSIPGTFNTMKCIDLYNSDVLERLTIKLTR